MRKIRDTRSTIGGERGIDNHDTLALSAREWRTASAINHHRSPRATCNTAAV